MLKAWKTSFGALLRLVFCLATTSTCHAEIRALVIGIDDYVHEAKLEGAVSDAEDIARALRNLGSTSVTILRNREASREQVVRHWRAMAASASRGDTLLLTFAGHGSREDQAGSGRTVNAFLLAEFARGSEWGRSERITNDELKQWFRAAREAEDVGIVLVADTCHSGSMMRTVDKRVTTSERAVPPYGLPSLAEVPADAKAGALLDIEQLKRVTFLAATEEDKRIQAIPIDGKPRGALSYAFARAVERAAAEDGKLRRMHIESYVNPAVRQLSEGRQIPKLLPRSAQPMDVLLDGKRAGRTTVAYVGGALRIKMLNIDAAGIVRLISSLRGTVAFLGGEAPDLIWDARDGTVLNGHGDIVAYDVSAGLLQAIVERGQVVAELKRRALEQPLGMSLGPNDGRHRSGAKVTFRSDPPRYAYLTAFNLTADGIVQFLFPRAEFGDAPEWPPRVGYRIDLEVTRPFGAEHLVLIASDRPLHAFHRALRSARAADVPGLLSDAVKSVDYQMGIQGLYTFDGREER